MPVYIVSNISKQIIDPLDYFLNSFWISWFWDLRLLQIKCLHTPTSCPKLNMWLWQLFAWFFVYLFLIAFLNYEKLVPVSIFYSNLETR